MIKLPPIENSIDVEKKLKNDKKKIMVWCYSDWCASCRNNRCHDSENKYDGTKCVNMT